MRVSSHQLYLTTVRNIQQGTEAFNKYSVQLATSERILKPSDDPLGTMTVMNLDTQLKSLEQYKSNMDDVEFTLGQQETQLTSIVDLLISLQGLVTTAADNSMGTDEILALGQEMSVLFPGIVDLLNATNGNGEYFFSGSETQTMPFQLDGAGKYQYMGDDNIRMVATSDDSSVFSNVVGSDIAPNAQFLNDMNDYLAIVASPPATGVGNESRYMLDSIEDFLGTLTGQITRIGGVRSSIELMALGNEDIALFTQGLKDDISEADTAETYIKMNEAMASYESSLQVYSKISQLSLFSLI
ncbi:flagellar hook-associated protein FlgL [Aestuariibacter sp. A3R04]|uniref:flagellar hook-associated protein FlgL n=1 Tax=Aestuariibacter sp. A3R04 TaxID=2841571 RepID=UPI001C0A6146|nr:flagellar hook-associated protein FlgL [Aestuariibacter sp. A3R04]MBU3023136.1 flagellar hook-associated protein FlgL [Aestuariibacter sp. A3R04]